MIHRNATQYKAIALTFLMSVLGCAPSITTEVATSPLVGATLAAPEQPKDPAEPLESIVWVLSYDLRSFDDTWEWLKELPDSPKKHRALGVAGLIGVGELSRFELIEETLKSLETATTAYPEDPRIPLWASYIRWLAAYQTGDRTAIDLAYDDLRKNSKEYPSFTLFGFTLAVAADKDASPELIEEARQAYEQVVSSANDLQFAHGELNAKWMRRTADWKNARYNLPGTQALIGDLHLRAGDFEQARVAFYTATKSNASYQWPFRTEAVRRMEEAEELAESMEGVPSFGAMWKGARTVDDKREQAGFAGKIGNGSCTLCHTKRSIAEMPGGETEEVGFVRLRYRAPEDVPNPFPLFVALPSSSADDIPEGFAIGQTSFDPVWGEQIDDNTFDLLLPVKAGNWFIAGQISGGELGEHSGKRFETYLSKGVFNRPRFIDVRAGEITDIRNSLLVFVPKDPE